MDRETDRLIRNLIQEKGGRIREVNTLPIRSDGKNADLRIYDGDLYIKTKGEWLKLMSGDKIINTEIIKNITEIVSEGVLQHSSLSNMTSDDHHAKVHDLASHSDVNSKAGTGSTVVMQNSPEITTPTITDLTSVQHSHTNTAGGGTITEASISNLGTAAAMVADNLSVFASTTSAQLAGIISDETGSGALVFASSPAFTTPGIGAATGTSLDAGGTTLYASRAITVDTGGVLNIVLASAVGDDFTVDTDKLVVEGDTGRVGIGTASPMGHLDINTENAEATVVWINGEASQDKLLKFRHWGNTEAAGDAGYTGYIGSKVDNVLTLGHIDPSGTDVQVLHITEGGNVGIGTDAPVGHLEVEQEDNTEYDVSQTDSQRGLGTSLVLYNTSTTVNSFSQLVFRNKNSSTAGIRIASVLKGDSNSDLAISTNTNDIIYIDSSLERVGIRTTSPDSLFEVSGTNMATALTITAYEAGTSYHPIINLRRSKSDSETLVRTLDGDILGEIKFSGVDADPSFENSARIICYQDGATDTKPPGRLHLEAMGASSQKTNQLVLDTTGNVGIGTAAPTFHITALNSIGTSLFLGRDEASPSITDGELLGRVMFGGKDYTGEHLGGAQIVARCDTTDWTENDAIKPTKLTFHTQDANGVDSMSFANPRMTIDKDGKVGIGTDAPSMTTHLYASATTGDAPLPLLALELSDDGANTEIGEGPAINFYIGDSTPSDEGEGTIYARKGAGNSHLTGQVAAPRESDTDATASGGLSFSTAGNYNALVEKMRITSGGNVGIGTSLPGTALDIGNGSSANATITLNGWSGGDTKLLFENNHSAIGVIGYDISDSTTELKINSSGSLSDNHLVIQNDGKVGIGTEDPIGRISVMGGAVIGAGYAETGGGNVAAATNGLLVEGIVRIGVKIGHEKLEVGGTAHFQDLTYCDNKLQVCGSDFKGTEAETALYPISVRPTDTGEIFGSYKGSFLEGFGIIGGSFDKDTPGIPNDYDEHFGDWESA